MMDNIREKLVEILGKNARCPKEVSNCHDCTYWAIDVGCYEDEATADMLIANGVTIQQWIPVEHPPKEDGDYLVCYCVYGNKFTRVLSFAKNAKKIDKDFLRGSVWYWYDSEYGYVSTDSVTHWMPLPTPPKGE